VDIAGKTDMVLAALENEKAISTDGALKAFGNRLPQKCQNKYWEERVSLF
jgi:hypothetical protein